MALSRQFRSLGRLAVLWAVPWALAPLLLASPAASAQTRALPWTFTPLNTIGSSEQSGVFFAALEPRQVTTGPGDQIVVADREEAHLIVLDLTGRVLRTLGGRGRGPGEFAFLMAVAVAPDSSVWGVDAGQRGITGFRSAGGPPLAFPDLPGAGSLDRLGFVGRNTPVIQRSQKDTLFLWRADSGTRSPVASVVRPAYRRIESSRCGTRIPHRPVFATDLVWTAIGNVIAYSSGPDWSVTIDRPGTATGTMGRVAERRAATRESALLEVAAGARIATVGGGTVCVVPASDIVSGAGFAEQRPAYRSLLFQSPDILWAMHFTVAGENGLADIYSLRNGYVGTVSLGKLFPVGFLTNSRVLSLEHDADDVPLLRTWRIVP